MAPEIRRLLFFAIFFLCKTRASYSSCKKGCSVLSLFPPEGFNSFADLMIKLFFRNRKLYRDFRETDPLHLLEELNNRDFYP